MRRMGEMWEGWERRWEDGIDLGRTGELDERDVGRTGETWWCVQGLADPKIDVFYDSFRSF